MFFEIVSELYFETVIFYDLIFFVHLMVICIVTQDDCLKLFWNLCHQAWNIRVLLGQ